MPLDGTEIGISESQERMAVVVDPKDAEQFLAYAKEENLEAVPVAVVTESPRLVMNWRGKRSLISPEHSWIPMVPIRKQMYSLMFQAKKETFWIAQRSPQM